jgi:hypothetical protein
VRVVAHGPHAWFLLQDAEGYILAARCSRGAADFELLIRLTPEETREYRALGLLFLNYMAARVDYWSGDYLHRHERASGQAVNRAIADWQAAQRETG